MIITYFSLLLSTAQISRGPQSSRGTSRAAAGATDLSSGPGRRQEDRVPQEARQMGPGQLDGPSAPGKKASVKSLNGTHKTSKNSRKLRELNRTCRLCHFHCPRRIGFK